MFMVADTAPTLDRHFFCDATLNRPCFCRASSPDARSRFLPRRGAQTV